MKKMFLSVLMLAGIAIGVSAQGAYVEFKLTGAQSGVSGTSKAYYKDGNTRSEINMISAQMPAGMNRVSLTLKDKPNKSFVLNESNKTYTEVDLTGVQIDEDPSHYTITVIGKEKVNGYDCTHIKIKKAGSVTDEDFWVSTAVVNYKQYVSVKSKYTNAGFYKALAAKGVQGFPVRMLVTEHGKSMQIDLVKSEMRNMDASLFSLTGYKKDVSVPAVSPGSQSPPAEVQEMMKKMQSMSPEERQKMIEQLRKQQAATPH